MVDIKKAQDILVQMFSMKEEDAQKTRCKLEALQRLDATFGFLTNDNFGQYVNYLQDWTLNEIEWQPLQLFVRKLRQLYEHLKLHSLANLCERLFPICFHLLQQEDQITRKQALSMVIEILSSNYGIGYTKNIVKKLLNTAYNYRSFDSGLTIFETFKERFYENGEYTSVLSNPNLYSCYKSKKVLVKHLIVLSQQNLNPQLLELLLEICGRLDNAEEELIRVMVLKSRILLLLNKLKMGLISQELCFQHLQSHYEDKLIRVKYTMIELTPPVVEASLSSDIERHFEFMKQNINRLEPQLTELTISNLKHIFRRISHNERDTLLKKLLSQKSQIGVEGTSVRYIETIAQNIIDLLIDEESEEVLVDFLNKFIKDKCESVKLVLVKSFFKHEKSKHLYKYFRSLLSELYQSGRWRIRQQSLEVLDDVIEAFGVDESTMEILYNLVITDKAYRVRSDTIQLIKRRIMNENIRSYLLTMISDEYINTDYLRRIIVLELIKETYHLLTESPQVLGIYRHILTELSADSIKNVSDLAKSLLAGYLGLE